MLLRQPLLSRAQRVEIEPLLPKPDCGPTRCERRRGVANPLSGLSDSKCDAIAGFVAIRLLSPGFRMAATRATQVNHDAFNRQKGCKSDPGCRELLRGAVPRSKA